MARRQKCLLGFGIYFVVLTSLTALWTTSSFSKKENVLNKTRQSYKIWREHPTRMEFFMFNISNVNDILARNTTSVEVEQLGPYVFWELQTMANVTWYDNSTVAYYNQRWWNFDPESSNGTLDDIITNINPVVAAIANIVRDQNTFTKLQMDVILRTHHNNLFLNAKVSDLLFDGVSDPVLDIFKGLPFLGFIPYDKFAWFYSRNGSAEHEGRFLVDTGEVDNSKFGMLQKWRNSHNNSILDKCGEVRGMTRELWAPELERFDVKNPWSWTTDRDQMDIFIPDLCTYLTLETSNYFTTHGVDVVEYAANHLTFDNRKNIFSKACHCGSTYSECLSGALNISACHPTKAAVFVSLPHFLHSEPYYRSKVKGLEPSPSHNFKVILDKSNLRPLEVIEQLQFNLLIRRVPVFSIINALPETDTLVPMFWYRRYFQGYDDQPVLKPKNDEVDSDFVPYVYCFLLANIFVFLFCCILLKN